VGRLPPDPGWAHWQRTVHTGPDPDQSVVKIIKLFFFTSELQSLSLALWA